MKQDESVIYVNPEMMGGTAVFVGTRVPFEALLDYLKRGSRSLSSWKTSRS